MKAYELLDCPEKWTQNEIARDMFGDACNPDSQEACQFSLFGALSRTSVGPKPLLAKVLEVGKEIGCESLTAWNDKPGRTYDEVVTLLLILGL